MFLKKNMSQGIDSFERDLARGSEFRSLEKRIENFVANVNKTDALTPSPYMDALKRLRDGETAREDWANIWNKLCTSDGMLDIAVGAKVMLRRNIATHEGLVNGSTGKIRDVLYDNVNDPASSRMPYAVIVEFDSYTGDPFFDEPGRERWVPLRPQTHHFCRMQGTSGYSIL
jgi:hypothetical protein